MYGALSDQAIDNFLRHHYFGRLGFVLDGEVYIIPINYAYDDTRIYGHAPPGTKVAGMRQHPNVAFEVDEISDPAHWQSVLVHGRFVELREGSTKQAAFQRILAQTGSGERSEATWMQDLEQLVVFAIEITSRTGRFEHRAFLSTILGPSSHAEHMHPAESKSPMGFPTDRT